MKLVVPGALLTFALGAAIGCGDETGGTGAGGAAGTGGAGGIDDGKIRPPKSGVAIDEAAACAKVEKAFHDRATELGCAATTRSCPDLIRAPSGAPVCSQYDEGAAEGCGQYLTDRPDCETLQAGPDACIVAPIEGSEPAGCPT